MKDEGAVHATRAAGEIQFRLQDGHKHYMLCEACEQRLGAAENYMRTVCVGALSELSARGLVVERDGDDAFRVAGLDTILMTRAILGIVLKTHHAPSSYEKVPFPWLVERIRASLLVDDYAWLPGQAFGMKWMTWSDGPNPRAYAAVGIRRLRDGGVVAQVSIAGVDWVIALTEGRGEYVADLGALAKPWQISVGHARIRAVWFSDWDEWPHEEDSEDFIWGGLDDGCWCGSGSRRAACCDSTWLQGVWFGRA